MKDKLTTIFGLMAAIGTSASVACFTQKYMKTAMVFFVIGAIGQGGLGYFAKDKT